MFGQPSALLNEHQDIQLEAPSSDSIPATSFDGRTIFLKKRKRTQPSVVGPLLSGDNEY